MDVARHPSFEDIHLPERLLLRPPLLLPEGIHDPVDDRAQVGRYGHLVLEGRCVEKGREDLVGGADLDEGGGIAATIGMGVADASADTPP